MTTYIQASKKAIELLKKVDEQEVARNIKMGIEMEQFDGIVDDIGNVMIWAKGEDTDTFFDVCEVAL